MKFALLSPLVAATFGFASAMEPRNLQDYVNWTDVDWHWEDLELGTPVGPFNVSEDRHTLLYVGYAIEDVSVTCSLAGSSTSDGDAVLYIEQVNYDSADNTLWGWERVSEGNCMSDSALLYEGCTLNVTKGSFVEVRVSPFQDSFIQGVSLTCEADSNALVQDGLLEYSLPSPPFNLSEGQEQTFIMPVEPGALIYCKMPVTNDTGLIMAINVDYPVNISNGHYECHSDAIDNALFGYQGVIHCVAAGSWLDYSTVFVSVIQTGPTYLQPGEELSVECSSVFHKPIIEVEDGVLSEPGNITYQGPGRLFEDFSDVEEDHYLTRLSFDDNGVEGTQRFHMTVDPGTEVSCTTVSANKTALHYFVGPEPPTTLRGAPEYSPSENYAVDADSAFLMCIGNYDEEPDRQCTIGMGEETDLWMIASSMEAYGETPIVSVQVLCSVTSVSSVTKTGDLFDRFLRF